MSNLNRTKEYVKSVIGKDLTDEEAEWFLAMQAAEHMHDNTWKDNGWLIRIYIENPPTYKILEEDLFSYMDDDENFRSIMEEFVTKFYGLPK